MSASSVVLLPHAPSSVGAARRTLGADLRAHGIPEPTVSDAVVVVSELVSNAVRHADPLPGAQIQVAWTLHGGTLEIAVSDGGGLTQPRRVRPSRSASGGRGLRIVEHMSQHWGVRAGEPGMTVWVVLSATPHGSGRRRYRRLLARSRGRQRAG